MQERLGADHFDNGKAGAPEDWDFILKGLSLINREQIDAIQAAVWELEQVEYIVRSRERDGAGAASRRGLSHLRIASASAGFTYVGKANVGKSNAINKDRQIKDPLTTDGLNTDSIPILSPPSPLADGASRPPEWSGKEAATQSTVEIYREIIMENIEYSHLVRNTRTDREMLDEIVDLLVETVCSARKSIRIAGDDSTAELVKTKLMKMDSSHIEFVIDCLRKNTTETPEIPTEEKFSYAFRSLFWLEFDNLAHLPADYAEKPYSDGDFTALNA